MINSFQTPGTDASPAIEYDYSLNLSPLNRALYFSAGVDIQLLKHCPSYDRVKLQGIGGTVVATAILAFISGSYAFYTVFGPKSVNNPDEFSFMWMLISCFFGLVWGSVIYNLDRFIVSTTGHGDGTDSITWAEIFKALPRMLMAVLIGIVLSKPLEIRIMKTEIDAVLFDKQKEKSEEYIATAKDKLDLDLLNINTPKKELISQKEKKEQDLKKLEKDVQNSIDIYNEEMKSGLKEKSKKKEEQMNDAKGLLAEGKARLLPEISELEIRIKEKDQQVVQANSEFQQAIIDAKLQAGRIDGLIKRIEIAHETSKLASYFLTAMLIFIEISPLFFKMMLTLSPIDYLTDNQKRLARIRRGIAIDYAVGANGEAIMDGKQFTYHEAELEATRTIGKLKIDQQLTAQVQEEFTRIVSADISKNPNGYIDRLPPSNPPSN